jgi:hypothetical protein
MKMLIFSSILIHNIDEFHFIFLLFTFACLQSFNSLLHISKCNELHIDAWRIYVLNNGWKVITMIFNEIKNLLLDFDICDNYIDQTFLITISHSPPKLKAILLATKKWIQLPRFITFKFPKLSTLYSLRFQLFCILGLISLNNLAIKYLNLWPRTLFTREQMGLLLSCHGYQWTVILLFLT